jgi:hypothetical protein
MMTLKYHLILLIGFCLIGCTSIKIQIGAKMTMKHKDNLEASMNVRPMFNVTPSQWSPMFKQNMNDAWRELNIRGINYFLLGKPKMFRGYVSRSDINSKYYQSWFGCYVIQADNDVFSFPNININTSPHDGIMEYSRVAEKDQIAWLYAMGDKTPYAKSVSFTPLLKLELDGREVQFFEGVIASHSDLTENQTSLSKLLGRPSARKWSGSVASNHDITLKGIYGIWYNESDRTVKIIYGCGSIFKLSNGMEIDYYSDIKDELIEMAKAVSFNSLVVN